MPPPVLPRRPGARRSPGRARALRAQGPAGGEQRPPRGLHRISVEGLEPPGEGVHAGTQGKRVSGKVNIVLD